MLKTTGVWLYEFPRYCAQFNSFAQSPVWVVVYSTLAPMSDQVVGEITGHGFSVFSVIIFKSVEFFWCDVIYMLLAQEEVTKQLKQVFFTNGWPGHKYRSDICRVVSENSLNIYVMLVNYSL